MDDKKKNAKVNYIALIVSLLAIVFSLPALWLGGSSKSQAEDMKAVNTYHSMTCSNLHHAGQRIRDAERLFDDALDDASKDFYWAEYQLAKEERQRYLEVHLANLAYQASGGNPLPDEDNLCVL